MATTRNNIKFTKNYVILCNDIDETTTIPGRLPFSQDHNYKVLCNSLTEKDNATSITCDKDKNITCQRLVEGDPADYFGTLEKPTLTFTATTSSATIKITNKSSYIVSVFYRHEDNTEYTLHNSTISANSSITLNVTKEGYYTVYFVEESTGYFVESATSRVNIYFKAKKPVVTSIINTLTGATVTIRNDNDFSVHLYGDDYSLDFGPIDANGSITITLSGKITADLFFEGIYDISDVTTVTSTPILAAPSVSVSNTVGTSTFTITNNASVGVAIYANSSNSNSGGTKIAALVLASGGTFTHSVTTPQTVYFYVAADGYTASGTTSGLASPKLKAPEVSASNSLLSSTLTVKNTSGVTATLYRNSDDITSGGTGMGSLANNGTGSYSSTTEAKARYFHLEAAGYTNSDNTIGYLQPKLPTPTFTISNTEDLSTVTITNTFSRSATVYRPTSSTNTGGTSMGSIAAGATVDYTSTTAKTRYFYLAKTDSTGVAFTNSDPSTAAVMAPKFKKPSVSVTNNVGSSTITVTNNSVNAGTIYINYATGGEQKIADIAGNTTSNPITVTYAGSHTAYIKGSGYTTSDSETFSTKPTLPAPEISSTTSGSGGASCIFTLTSGSTSIGGNIYVNTTNSNSGGTLVGSVNPKGYTSGQNTVTYTTYSSGTFYFYIEYSGYTTSSTVAGTSTVKPTLAAPVLSLVSNGIEESKFNITNNNGVAAVLYWNSSNSNSGGTYVGTQNPGTTEVTVKKMDSRYYYYTLSGYNNSPTGVATPGKQTLKQPSIKVISSSFGSTIVRITNESSIQATVVYTGGNVLLNSGGYYDLTVTRSRRITAYAYAGNYYNSATTRFDVTVSLPNKPTINTFGKISTGSNTGMISCKISNSNASSVSYTAKLYSSSGTLLSSASGTLGSVSGGAGASATVTFGNAFSWTTYPVVYVKAYFTVNGVNSETTTSANYTVYNQPTLSAPVLYVDDDEKPDIRITNNNSVAVTAHIEGESQVQIAGIGADDYEWIDVYEGFDVYYKVWFSANGYTNSSTAGIYVETPQSSGGGS